MSFKNFRTLHPYDIEDVDDTDDDSEEEEEDGETLLSIKMKIMLTCIV